MSRHIAIVTPVLDDWEAFAKLVAELARGFRAGDVAFHVVAVDDGSNNSFNPATIALPPGAYVMDFEIVRLALNLGHQRAIAVGLCAVLERRDIDAVVVMDSDGEDRPEDIAALLAASEHAPGRPILARQRADPKASCSDSSTRFTNSFSASWSANPYALEISRCYRDLRCGDSFIWGNCGTISLLRSCARGFRT